MELLFSFNMIQISLELKNLWIELLNYVNNIKRKLDSKLWLLTVDLSLIIQVYLYCNVCSYY